MAIKNLIYDTSNAKPQSLVMFNRVAQQDAVAAHNITSNMSKSKKKTPVSTICCCKSQKRGKQLCHRKFRRRERAMIQKGDYARLPFRMFEVTEQWSLGGDGKCFFGFNQDEEWFVKLMRK